MNGRFTLWIELGNESMSNELELAGTLDMVSEKVARGERSGTIRDLNGNTVGRFTLEEE